MFGTFFLIYCSTLVSTLSIPRWGTKTATLGRVAAYRRLFVWDLSDIGLEKTEELRHEVGMTSDEAEALRIRSIIPCGWRLKRNDTPLHDMEALKRATGFMYQRIYAAPIPWHLWRLHDRIETAGRDEREAKRT